VCRVCNTPTHHTRITYTYLYHSVCPVVRVFFLVVVRRVFSPRDSTPVWYLVSYSRCRRRILGDRPKGRIEEGKRVPACAREREEPCRRYATSILSVHRPSFFFKVRFDRSRRASRSNGRKASACRRVAHCLRVRRKRAFVFAFVSRSSVAPSFEMRGDSLHAERCVFSEACTRPIRESFHDDGPNLKARRKY